MFIRIIKNQLLSTLWCRSWCSQYYLIIVPGKLYSSQNTHNHTKHTHYIPCPLQFRKIQNVQITIQPPHSSATNLLTANSYTNLTIFLTTTTTTTKTHLINNRTITRGSPAVTTSQCPLPSNSLRF